MQDRRVWHHARGHKGPYRDPPTEDDRRPGVYDACMRRTSAGVCRRYHLTARAANGGGRRRDRHRPDGADRARLEVGVVGQAAGRGGMVVGASGRTGGVGERPPPGRVLKSAMSGGCGCRPPGVLRGEFIPSRVNADDPVISLS
jgi:hypothetical protein